MKNVIVSVLVALLVAGGVSALQSPGVGVQGPQGVQGVPGPVGPQGPAGRNGVSPDLSALTSVVKDLQSKLAEAKLGATPGNVFDSKSLIVNGVETYQYSIPFNFASTSLCSVRTPNATTTLKLAAGKISTATTTALYLEWGKALVQNATTTSLGTRTVASGVLGTFLASTSPAEFAAGGDNFDDQRVVAPLSYLELKAGGFTPAAGGPLRGTCKVEFVVN